MKASDDQQIMNLYEATADSYATMMDKEIKISLYADVLSRLSSRIAEMSGPLVDTSCGSGHMLGLYHDRYDQDRDIIGVDLVPAMVAIARSKLPASADVRQGDMRCLEGIANGTAAAVFSYFSLHHLDEAGLEKALLEWHRVLQPGGQLVLATWEGSGSIDYGEDSDVVAFKYPADKIRAVAESAGFTIDKLVTEPVEDMQMDALYLEGSCK